VPAIKGDMYINTHCNYSQPTLIKLDNENIGGHLTPLQPEQYCSVHRYQHQNITCHHAHFVAWQVTR